MHDLRSRLCLVAAGCALCLGLPGVACSQDTAASAPDTLTLHASANLVVIDVSVTDGGGKPVHGLKASDFHLAEDKAPQHIRSFEEHTLPATSAVSPGAPKLQPGVFTNAFTVPTDSPVNVLLLDTLNTPMNSQAFVHGQLVKYLKTARPGTRMAIFALTGGHLVMLQGLTTDPTLLRFAIAHAHPQASHVLAGNAAAAGAASVEAELAAASPGLADAIQEFQQDESDTNEGVAARETLQALNQLARYLAGIPGRKNLVWFGGGFPFTIRPGGKSDSVPRYMAASLSDATPWVAEYRETIGLLTHARVAIYPADANGIEVYGLNQRGMTGAQWANREAMLDLAEDTGGHAFFNTNGLAEAIDEVTTNGASYYTLAYTPTHNNAHGEYRNVRIQLGVKGRTLSYRHGYYAELPTAVPNADTQLRAIGQASRYTAPPATQIHFYAHIAPVPPSAESALTHTAAHRQLAPERFHHDEVEFSVDPLALAITTSPDGTRQARLEFLTLVYDPLGRVVNSNGEATQATWSPAQYATALEQGVRYKQHIDVPVAGPHTIRMLIRDLSNDKIGSVDIPAASLESAP